MKRLLVWGTGNLAESLIAVIGLQDIIGFVETKKTKNTFMGKEVFQAYMLSQLIFDYLIVANTYEYDIKEFLYYLDIRLEKVIFINYKLQKVLLRKEGISLAYSDYAESKDVYFMPTGIQTDSKAVMELVKKEGGNYWENGVTYSPSVENRDIFLKETEYIENVFLPRIENSDKVYDLGCGDGTITRMIALKSAEVFGTDLSPDNIEKAKRINNSEGFNNITLECKDASSIKFKHQYKAITCLGMYLYLKSYDEIKEITKQINKGIKKDGYFLFRNPLSLAGTDIYMYRPQDDYACTYFDMKKVEEIIRNEGFELVDKARLVQYGCSPYMLGQYMYLFRKA